MDDREPAAIPAARSPAVFLDKDGTLVEDIPYNVDPDLICLSPGAERLANLAEAGYRLVVVSNQSGVARGYFPESALTRVQARLRSLLAELGVELAGFYFCPHHPDGALERYAVPCRCRKPRPGMLERASEELNLDLGRSWMVGDILDDVEAGREAGCRTVLIDNGHETEWIMRANRVPDLRVPSLSDAVEAILSRSVVRSLPIYAS